MKCCGSPTTFTAVNSGVRAPAAANVMQAVLFSEILKPISAALGPLGDSAVAAVTQGLFIGKSS